MQSQSSSGLRLLRDGVETRGEENDADTEASCGSGKRGKVAVRVAAAILYDYFVRARTICLTISDLI